MKNAKKSLMLIFCIILFLSSFDGISEYYTITGSTNLKLDEHVSKANVSVVVKEYTTAHPVYNEYKDIYNYEYQN